MGKQAFSILFVCLGVGGGLWCGGGWMPLPTRPQQYCDPASLVFHAYVLRKFTHLALLLLFSFFIEYQKNSEGETGWRSLWGFSKTKQETKTKTKIHLGGMYPESEAATW